MFYTLEKIFDIHYSFSKVNNRSQHTVNLVVQVKYIAYFTVISKYTSKVTHKAPKRFYIRILVI